MRITKQRVEQLMELHEIDADELIGGTTISNEDFDLWLKGTHELTYDQEQTVFERALNIDLQERNDLWGRMKKSIVPINSLIKQMNISDGLFRMWLTGRRNMPYEIEKAIYDKYDEIKERF